MAIIVSKKGSHSAQVVNSSDFTHERNLQDYICDHPEAIPVEDKRLLVVARELQTESGSIDAFAVDKDGDLYIVETKLYRNPDKRTVVAQALDYGASLWRHADFDELLSTLDQTAEKEWKMRIRDKLAEFFSLEEEGVDPLIEAMRRNLLEGKLKFVVLMDKLEDRLKDLIAYVNENSQFDIYAVEIEFYTHEEYEIVIPKLYGAEVKKDVGVRSSGRLWTWDLFKDRLREYGEEEVIAAQHIIDWAGNNDIAIEWSQSQRGGFILCYYPEGKNGFYPFGVTGKGTVSWNAPHQGGKSPSPFDKRENRAEILKRLQPIKGATVDLNNVDGFNGLKLPLRILADKEALDTFFSVCSWIKEDLAAKAQAA
ncbi:MAG: hypothetical protein LAO03_23410 [Acidobacteriia bacterium]|nr:hypothetical protein [Terriglobia bacterium]